VLEAFVASAIPAVQAATGIDVAPTYSHDPIDVTDQLVVLVRMTGDLRGITCVVPPALALHHAERATGLSDIPPELASEAALELANVVIGRVTAALIDVGLELDIQRPPNLQASAPPEGPETRLVSRFGPLTFVLHR
jgi:CheY-specific phosphatase CheX